MNEHEFSAVLLNAFNDCVCNFRNTYSQGRWLSWKQSSSYFIWMYSYRLNPGLYCWTSYNSCHSLLQTHAHANTCARTHTSGVPKENITCQTYPPLAIKIVTYKYFISVRSSHCGYLSQAPKHLDTPLHSGNFCCLLNDETWWYHSLI